MDGLGLLKGSGWKTAGAESDLQGKILDRCFMDSDRCVDS